MSEKPEWFEMASDDSKPSEPKFKSKKRIAKIAIFTAPLLLVGGAMVFAEGDESDDAPKMDTTIPTATTNSSDNSANSTAVIENASTSNRTSNATSKSAANTKNISISSNNANSSDSSKSDSNVGIANPATNNSGTGVGVPKPSGRGGDDGGHEGRERRHGEGHEGGEHEFGGDDD